MPLNYSKWDQLEVSDDSDIEGHPNVDHKSLVRMKQRTIHEQRYARNQLIAQLEADLALNAELLPRARKIASELKASDDKPAFFSRTVDRLKNAPDPAGPAGGGDSYETMLYHLMLTVYEDVKKAGVKQDDDKLGQALQDALDTHVKGLEEDTKKKEVQLDSEKKEKAKKITTEDIHEGFQSAYVPAKPDPAPVPGADSLAPKTKGKGKQKETTIEVLNPKASGSADVSQEDEDDEDSDLPQLTPALIEFSKIPIGRFEQSYQFIQAHREVIVPGAADALLVAAFDAQGNGKPKYSKQCVHQSLLVQYCEKLGGDGVRVFFMKMISGDKRATDVFVKDVEETYQHLKGRVAASKEASAGSGEQIQIVAEGGADSVSFNVPDGPPPAELVLEGEGVQDLDVEEVRKVLQMRWDVFEGFSDELKQALRLNSLDAVNAVLGKMSVEEAEGVVGMLDMGGILNFAEGGVRDETPAGKAAAAATTEPSASESAESAESAPKDA